MGESHGNLTSWSWINTTSTGCVFSAIFARVFAGCPRSRRLVFRPCIPGSQLYGIRGICRNHPKSSRRFRWKQKWRVLKIGFSSATGRTPRKKMTATGKGGGFTAGAKGKGGLDGLNVAPCAPCSSLDGSESILCRVLVQKQWAK